MPDQQVQCLLPPLLLQSAESQAAVGVLIPRPAAEHRLPMLDRLLLLLPWCCLCCPSCLLRAISDEGNCQKVRVGETTDASLRLDVPQLPRSVQRRSVAAH